MTKREQLYPEIRRLRENEGLTFREIGERVGLSPKMAHAYCTDPYGEKVRARKAKQVRACLDCGEPCNFDGKTTNPSERCPTCAHAHKCTQSQRWIIESFGEWNRLFGAPPSAVDWNPSHARASKYCTWKAERHARTGRSWPSISLVIYHFGSWNEGLRAAGFQPLAPSEYWIGHAGCVLRAEGRVAA